MIEGRMAAAVQQQELDEVLQGLAKGEDLGEKMGTDVSQNGNQQFI